VFLTPVRCNHGWPLMRRKPASTEAMEDSTDSYLRSAEEEKNGSEFT
jgi:hypothetical protein